MFVYISNEFCVLVISNMSHLYVCSPAIGKMVMRGFCVSNATKKMVRSQWEDDVWMTVNANCARPRMNQYLSMLRQLIRVPSFFLSVAHAKLWNSTIICLCMKKELNIYFSSNQIAIQNFFLVIQKVIRFIPLCCLQTNVALLSLQCKCKGECVVWLRIVFSMKHQFDFHLFNLFRFFFHYSMSNA